MNRQELTNWLFMISTAMYIDILMMVAYEVYENVIEVQ